MLALSYTKYCNLDRLLVELESAGIRQGEKFDGIESTQTSLEDPSAPKTTVFVYTTIRAEDFSLIESVVLAHDPEQA